MRRSLKGALGAGALAGAAYAAWRSWSARVPERRGVDWSTAPFPFPPVPRPAAPQSPPQPQAHPEGARAAWVEPDAEGACPESHPVKAKLSSGIFHVPGGANYERTKPDRCYVDEAAAVADGLRPSKV